MGMMMVVGVLRDHPDIPIPDCEWGVAERAARERMAMGVLISESPLRALRGQLKRWRSPISPEPPVPLHRLPDTRFPIQTIGVVAEFSIIKKKTRFARMRLVGTSASVDCIIWSKALERIEQSPTGVPTVGAIIGVDAKIQQRKGQSPSEGWGDESPVAHELVVSHVWQGELDDPARISLRAAGRPAA
jgi:DNA polymerase III alpha subunit